MISDICLYMKFVFDALYTITCLQQVAIFMSRVVIDRRDTIFWVVRPPIHHPLIGTTSYSTYVIDPLNLDNGWSVSWNDVDVLITFNLDLDLDYFPRSQKIFNIMPLTGTTSYTLINLTICEENIMILALLENLNETHL